MSKRAEELARRIYFDDDGNGRTTEARIAALIDAELRKVARKAIDRYWLMGSDAAKNEAVAAILAEEEG